MPSTESSDGTTIAFDRTGEGPALVLVVGAFCDRMTTKGLTAHLTDRYTVYEYDRRGRGDTGGERPDSVAQEVADLAAVVAATETAPFVFGHSSGAALALEAAAADVPMRRIAVYEPPYTGPGNPGTAFADELDALVAAGKREQAAERWLGVTGAPPPVIEMIKSGPGWSHMCGLAHTLSCDMRLANEGQVPAQRLEAINVPVLAIAGAASAPWAAEAAVGIVDAVADGRQQVLEGQTHMAADDVLAPVLDAFFQAAHVS